MKRTLFLRGRIFHKERRVSVMSSFQLDFIGDRLAFDCSQGIFYHHLYHPSCGGVGVGANMGGDQHIREVKKRMVPAQTRHKSLLSSTKR